MKDSADLGGCYPPRPWASVDNTLFDLQKSSYPTRPHSITANSRLVWQMFIAQMAPGGPVKYYGDLLDKLVQDNRSVNIFPAYFIVVENIPRCTIHLLKRVLNSEKPKLFCWISHGLFVVFKRNFLPEIISVTLKYSVIPKKIWLQAAGLVS